MNKEIYEKCNICNFWNRENDSYCHNCGKIIHIENKPIYSIVNYTIYIMLIMMIIFGFINLLYSFFLLIILVLSIIFISPLINAILERIQEDNLSIKPNSLLLNKEKYILKFINKNSIILSKQYDELKCHKTKLLDCKLLLNDQKNNTVASKQLDKINKCICYIDNKMQEILITKSTMNVGIWGIIFERWLNNFLPIIDKWKTYDKIQNIEKLKDIIKEIELQSTNGKSILNSWITETMKYTTEIKTDYIEKIKISLNLCDQLKKELNLKIVSLTISSIEIPINYNNIDSSEIDNGYINEYYNIISFSELQNEELTKQLSEIDNSLYSVELDLQFMDDFDIS